MIKVTLDFWSTQTQHLLQNLKISLKNVSGIGTTSGKQGLGELDTDNKEVPLARQRLHAIAILSKMCKLYSRIIIFG